MARRALRGRSREAAQGRGGHREVLHLPAHPGVEGSSRIGAVGIRIRGVAIIWWPRGV